MSDKSDKYEYQEAKADELKLLGGVIVAACSFFGWLKKVGDSNKELQIARDKDELNRLNSKFFKTTSDKRRIEELQRNIKKG